MTKINAAGSAFVFSTYLGGSGDDNGIGIAADSAGNASVTGQTLSTDFPTKNAIQPTFAGGQIYGDAFVTKINAGTALVYSTFLGGSGDDSGIGIAVDTSGDVYVIGFTSSPDFPAKNAIQPGKLGFEDAFVTKINATGTALVYSTFLGGSGDEAGIGIALDSAGDAYVSGVTYSPDFPTVNAIQPSFGGGQISGDAFVTKINAAGNALVYSTYLGGKLGDQGSGIAADSTGSAYVAGSTSSLNFPVTPVPYQPTLRNGGKRSNRDAFVAKIAQQTFVSVSPAKIRFPPEVLNTTSPSKKITVTNQGSGTLTINKVFIGGLDPSDFAETNTCGPSLAAGASCTISVTFTPTVNNRRKAGLGISSSDPGSPDAIALSGTGTVVSLSKKKLSFGNQPVGTKSAPQNVTLTNVGTTQLNFTGITITGTNAGDFSETNTCGTSIAAGANCTITVTFTPTATGTRTAAVSISDDGGGSPQKVSLTGTGT